MSVSRTRTRRFFGLGRLAVLLVAGLLMASAPAVAGEFSEKAKSQLEAFGVHAGYIVATIGPCGGNDAEIDYFTDQVRIMLESIGGDAADFAIVQAAMTKGRADAEPKGRDCTDEGGMDLASKLAILRDAIRGAGK
ncbi:MAG: hypothetical protein ISP41_07715 [Alphaproteobacteria bacterium]|jgi:hypothetical protein|nr:hypothetical protein [Alphaproteobacteria bacterium]